MVQHIRIDRMLPLLLERAVVEKDLTIESDRISILSPNRT